MNEENLYAIDIPQTGITYIGTSKDDSTWSSRFLIMQNVTLANTQKLIKQKMPTETYKEGVFRYWKNEGNQKIPNTQIERKIEKIIHNLGKL